MTAAQLRVGESFRHEVSATLRRFNEVLTPFADIKSVSPLLSRYEEHLSGFFGCTTKAARKLLNSEVFLIIVTISYT